MSQLSECELCTYSVKVLRNIYKDIMNVSNKNVKKINKEILIKIIMFKVNQEISKKVKEECAPVMPSPQLANDNGETNVYDSNWHTTDWNGNENINNYYSAPLKVYDSEEEKKEVPVGIINNYL